MFWICPLERDRESGDLHCRSCAGTESRQFLALVSGVDGWGCNTQFLGGWQQRLYIEVSLD